MAADNHSRRVAAHHQRSSSTGSHAHMFGVGVAAAAGPHHVHGHFNHFLHHQSSGSPDLLSDDEAAAEAENWGGDNSSADIQGTLSKWTNYIHGWQDRYIALKEGTLVYYKSACETDFGCRGAISIDKATVKPHDLDELRFDVSVSDCVWYLRATSVEDRQKWIDTLENAKRYLEASGGPTINQLVQMRRHDSALSLTSTASKGAFGKSNHHRSLTEKLAEMETFRDILCRQVDTLQGFFDKASLEMPNGDLSSSGDEMSHDRPVPVVKSPAGVDFKGEAITFKATTAGILATMSHCIDIMTQREEQWRKKLEREQTARKRIEEKYKHAVDEAEQGAIEIPMRPKMVKMGGLDYEEGPLSQIGEDEFFDAVENALDKLQEEQDYRDKLKLMSNKSIGQMANPLSEATQHQLWSTIDKVTKEQLHYARLKVGQDSVWELFAEDGEMRMYKREEEIDGLVVDPLKALHQVRGVTARELCHYFFAPEVRMEWETTVEQATVLEKICEDTLIFLQLHKRVWPAAQRDALFWSHMRRIPCVPGDDDEQPADETWIVCNQSTKHPDAPENQGGCVRVDLTVCFVCDTIIDPPYTRETARREHLTTKITYCSVVNPGGWAPASVLRAVYKREYPRFLKRFTQYVDDKSRDKDIFW